MAQDENNADMQSVDEFFQSLQESTQQDKRSQKPFKFLEPYNIEDRQLFFGRDLEIAEVYRKFYATRLLLIYGESGSGKTSLIQCGLQAEIPPEKAVFLPVLFAVDDIEETLRHTLQKYLGNDANTQPIRQLLTDLRKQQHKTIVLVLDQFEEFFLQHNQVEQQQFIQKMLKWQETVTDIRVIISIHEDYYARLTELESDIPDIFDNRFWLRPMTKNQARDVITKPCQHYDIAVEETLVEKLLNDLLVDNKEIDLPVLQVVLGRLYDQAKKDDGKKLTFSLEVYLILGRSNNILENFINSMTKQHNTTNTYIEQSIRNTQKLEQIRRGIPSFLEVDKSKFTSMIQGLRKNQLIRNTINNSDDSTRERKIQENSEKNPKNFTKKYDVKNRKYPISLYLGILLFMATIIRMLIFNEVYQIDSDIIINVDSIGYERPALSLLHNGTFFGDEPQDFNKTEILRFPPGYPVFIAAVYSVFGEVRYAVAIVQILVSIFSVWLLYLIAAKLWSKKTGFIVASLMVFEPLQIYYAQVMMSEVLFIPTLLLFVLFSIHMMTNEKQRYKYAVLMGLALAAGTMIRPVNYYMIIPVLIGLTVGCSL